MTQDDASPASSAGSPGVGALADLRVVELGVWVAAPAAAALRADRGADAIEVEPPTGDPMRNVFGWLGIGHTSMQQGAGDTAGVGAA